MDFTGRNPCEVSREDFLEETQNTYGERMNERALAYGGRLSNECGGGVAECQTYRR